MLCAKYGCLRALGGSPSFSGTAAALPAGLLLASAGVAGRGGQPPERVVEMTQVRKGGGSQSVPILLFLTVCA